MNSKPATSSSNSSYGPLFIRISIGAYFIIAGLTKLDHIDAFVNQIRSFGFVSYPLATAYGGVLPYLEILTGLMLIFGFLTTIAASLCCVMLGTFIYAIGFFPYAKVAFASNLFNKDIILFCATISLFYSGPGAFSIDGFRRSG